MKTIIASLITIVSLNLFGQPSLTNINNGPFTNPPPWTGTMTVQLVTKRFNTPTFPADTNHMLTLSKSYSLLGPWVDFTNVLGGSTVAVTLTNASTLIRARADGFVAWSSSFQAVTNTAGGCPGPYIGYAIFSKPNPTWGWVATSTTNLVTDPFRTDTKVQYFGEYGDNGCAQTSNSIPVLYSPAYQFAVYFHTNLPTATYPLWLKQGFNP